MTLIEILVATGLGGLVLGVAMTLNSYTARSFAAMANYVNLDQMSRSALDQMSREIRQADKLTSYSPTRLDFRMIDPNSGAVSTLTYSYGTTTKTLTRAFNGQITVLLKELQNLEFKMYQRTIVSNSWEQYQVTDPNLCKLVHLNWTCSRKLLGRSINSESVQSARVVMRKA